MFRTLAIAATTATLAVPAFADGHAASGDVAAGEKAFRQCISCHVVQNEAGDTLAGRNAKTGPNLYGIAGGQFGMVEDFRYSDINQLAAEMEDLVITEEVFVTYVQDPTAYLREVTGDKGRSKMTFKVRKEEDAVNLYAYLASLQADGGS
ncbi:cytochrome C [uncultured Tateyamaria sp.]|uniref:c-type cytochrome n=1 Tax=uncultured Tateyamaria sp. TaxID=455651 RepID=UPI0026360BF7|nr:cytochrome C [uncultured Tateyamaria sp.]